MTRKPALITGASSGIGAILAELFAKDGHDVVLVARNTEKLAALAERLQSQFSIGTYVLSADLAKPEAAQSMFDDLARRGVTVDFLVNNAGFGTNGDFLDLPLDKELEMIQVNITALVQLCHVFGTSMRQRGFGRILNIASTAGFQPGPYMATYYASKAFVISFSEALAYELEASKVTVTCCCPGATATAFAERSGSSSAKMFNSPMVAKPEAVALHAYRAMLAGRRVTVHGALNRIGTLSVRFAPRSLAVSIAATLNRH
jgi:uncharacterized protein